MSSGDRFSALESRWAIVRLDPRQPLPDRALSASGFVSVTRTPRELSIVCPESLAPAGVRVEPGWTVLALHGPFPFDQVGVLASFAAPLASAGHELVS